MTLNQSQVLPKSILLTTLLNYFFHAQHCHIVCVVYLKLVLFDLKCKVLIQTVVRCVFIWKLSYLHADINVTFYVSVVFVRLKAKCKIFIFIFSCLWHTILFLHLLFSHICLLSMVQSEVMD